MLLHLQYPLSTPQASIEFADLDNMDFSVRGYVECKSPKLPLDSQNLLQKSWDEINVNCQRPICTWSSVLFELSFPLMKDISRT